MSKPKNRIVCPDCGKPKMLFDSESSVNNFIRFNNKEIGNYLRSYYCPACCGWHITKMQYSSKYEGRTDKLINAYKTDKSHHSQKDYELIEVVFNKLVAVHPKDRAEANSILKGDDYKEYHFWIKDQAKIKYYNEFNI